MKSISSLHKTPEARQICLASASPRRLSLLRQVGIEPEVRPAHLDESRLPEENLYDYVQRMAISKAKAVAMPDDDLILAADTIVVLNGELLGKPDDAEHATQMLQQLAGQEHQVLTAIALYQPSSQRLRQQTVQSRVWIKQMSAQEIAAYVATGEPLDKAGSYGIQGAGAALVARMEGSCSGVAGLPLCETLTLLRDFT
ncbi:Maf family protein [Candidatus Magnetaquicoccus inordinatus]|uniref:Maf family protein n=1 Tax=Candidatus Magnetaquicoccus inordinatus TaxID=2496818 RepID=UPI00102CB3B3|nr:Maf family protein [Candidatus Magnetaquicoccus inordinatus]